MDAPVMGVWCAWILHGQAPYNDELTTVFGRTEDDARVQAVERDIVPRLEVVEILQSATPKGAAARRWGMRPIGVYALRRVADLRCVNHPDAEALYSLVDLPAPSADGARFNIVAYHNVCRDCAAVAAERKPVPLNPRCL